MSSPTASPPRRISPVRAVLDWKRQKRAGDTDIYRIIVARNDIRKSIRILNAINEKIQDRKGKPLFDKLIPFQDVIVCHSVRTNFRKIVNANMGDLSPCILRSPSLPGRRHYNRFGVTHPSLGPL